MVTYLVAAALDRGMALVNKEDEVIHTILVKGADSE